MVMQGETIATGAPSTCPDCHVVLHLMVLRSGAGYYIGTMCNCGPYSRESGYYPSVEAAQEVLDSGEFGRPSGFIDYQVLQEDDGDPD